ncbi:MAG TPA: hypothetical protein OIM20_01825 [Eggerthellaceae bacterium]|nr:hypothetical protein [Eggerthellaceae bacterium]
MAYEDHERTGKIARSTGEGDTRRERARAGDAQRPRGTGESRLCDANEANLCSAGKTS